MTPFARMRQELREWSDPGGMSPSVLLQLSEPLRGALRQIMRQGSVTFVELSVLLDLTMADTEEIADLLVACGFLKTTETGEDGGLVYRIQHTKNHRPGAPLGVWNTLLESEDPSDREGG